MNASPPGLRRSAPLPYRLIAGVEPCRAGWLVLPGKVDGAALGRGEPEVVPTLREILDARPAYEAIALHAPVGVPLTSEGRACDRAARQLLHHRSSAIVAPPCRGVLDMRTFAQAKRRQRDLSTASWHLRRKVTEATAELAPHWQRVVWEVNPELTFLSLNGGRPMQFAKTTAEGRAERLAVLEPRIPGISALAEEHIPGVSAERLIDAAADLWTARRILAKGAARIPEDPEWDEEGIRMQLVY